MKNRSIWQLGIVRYVICVSLGLWLVRFLHFVLLDRLTIFLLPLLWLIAVIAVLVGLGWAIYFGMRAGQTGDRGWQRSLPLAIQTGGLILALLLPFEQFWLTLNFHQHLTSRQQVIALVQANQIVGTTNNIAALPAAYQQTSMTREIQTLRNRDGLYILFFTGRTLGGAEGFVYSENAKLPSDDLSSGYKLQVQRTVNSHWYYVTVGEY